MKWTRPSGIEIETNDLEETIEYCKSIGWESIELVKEKPKRTRRTKEQMKADKLKQD